ncbi:hypothetical protein U0023_32375 (plasmid) [Microvirga lotononidis]|uniref:Uncharacterized protein n=1 Tax=Microvirga lotononidis TaxID=864069 RepID=I4Z119_9HYPH|nr:hypothetical protein [Microvirga lotononidis]EIM29911.1 hypothetical protein MicloDRAFT_00012320 [Microvirga lotononidis]WQO31012.1 hypothetical protein U0023_32375 [Microvirga lotononidis]
MPDNATAKAQAEAAWRESKRRLQEVIGVTELSPDFRALFDATPRPFLVLASDLTIVPPRSRRSARATHLHRVNAMAAWKVAANVAA